MLNVDLCKNFVLRKQINSMPKKFKAIIKANRTPKGINSKVYFQKYEILCIV